MARRNRELRRNALFAAVAVVLVLYLAEVGLRLAGVEPPYQADAVGGWRMLPQATKQTMHAHEGTSFVVSTNADGLRTTVPKSRTPGVPRVALLGDSTVFGWGVDDGQTVADALAAGLAAKGLVTEVIDAGQPGYSTTQVERLYTTVVAAYRPDLAVVFIPMHDDNRVLVSDREHLDGASGAVAKLRVLLATRSRIYQVLRNAVLPFGDAAALVPGRDGEDATRVPRVSDTERRANLDSIRTTTAAWGGRLVLGHLPFLADLEGKGGDRFSVGFALAYAAASPTPILDLRACCAGKGGAALTLPNDPGHLNAEGNRLAGEAAAGPVYELLVGSSSR